MSTPGSHGRELVRSMAFLEFGTNSSLNANQTQYMAAGMVLTIPASTVEARYQVPVPVKRKGRLSGLRVYAAVAPTSDFVVVFTVRVNGASTAITCTMSAGQRLVTDLANSVDIDPGDLVALQTVTTNTAGVSPSFIHASLAVDEIP